MFEALPTVVLAFDLATRTGWAVDAEEDSASGWFDLRSAVKSGRAGPSWGGQLLWARAEILSRFAKATIPWRPRLRVVVEQPQRFKSRRAAQVCYGLYTVLCEESARVGVEPVEVNGSTLKKWATGDGRADKNQMRASATARLSRPIKDHNEADAVLLALYAREELKL